MRASGWTPRPSSARRILNPICMKPPMSLRTQIITDQRFGSKSGGGIVEFMVASPIGTARIYTQWVQVKENGSFDCRSGRAWCDDLKMGGIVY